MRVHSVVMCGVMAVVASSVSAGEPLELRLDPAGSRASFTLGSTLHTVHGEMPITRGAVRFDPEGGAASGEVVLDARGAVTGNRKRDAKMHEEVLRTDEFPQLVFRLARTEGALPEEGPGELRLVGTLEVQGVTHDVVIPAVVSRRGAGVEGHGSVSIPYVAWGLEDPSVFVLRADKQVEVELDVRGALSQ